MNRNIFSPRLSAVNSDTLSGYLLSGAQIILLILVIALPLLYFSSASATLGLQKGLLLFVAGYSSLLLLCLAVLRRGSLRLVNPFPYFALSGFVLVALVSGLLSGDVTDAVWGTALESQTVIFFLLLGVLFTLSHTLSASLEGVKRFLYFGLGSLGLVLWLSVLSMFVESWRPWLLPNGVSLLGTLNDLALVSGMVIIGLIASIQSTTITTTARLLTLALLVPAVIILMIVNFTALWMATAFFSLLSLLYLLAKDTWLKAEDSSTAPVSRLALGLVGLVCLVSGTFLVSGDYLGQRVSAWTGISYLEVRPSLTATAQIAQSIYQTDLLLGAGPNRFEDAWRLHKSSAITETAFWNTNFSSGYSYITTLFVTTGLLGGLIFISFIAWLIYAGYRLLMQLRTDDRATYTVATGVFAVVLTGWVMTFMYTPGVVVMVILFMLSGLLLRLYDGLFEMPVFTLDVKQVRQHGLVIITVVLLAIIGFGGALFKVGKQFTAYTTYASAQAAFATAGDLAVYDRALERAFGYFPQDIYVSERARLRLNEVSRLLNLPDPSAEDERRFEQAFTEGISLANQAIQADGTNPYNHALRASFLTLLPDTSDEVLEERSRAFDRAKTLDPRNPEYYLLEAQLLAQRGRVDEVRSLLTEALRTKSNYAEALAFLAQLEIAQGNTTAAIEVSRAMVTADPSNPARYFQLGLLLSATEDVRGALEAFQLALRLDPNYANARYLAAVALLDLGETEAALNELRTVRNANPDNQELLALISAIEAGELATPARDFDLLPAGPSIMSNEEVVTTSDLTPTDQISPVNRPATRPQTDNTDAAEERLEQNIEVE